MTTSAAQPHPGRPAPPDPIPAPLPLPCLDVVGVAERIHGGPFGPPLCDNPRCEAWCVAEADKAINATTGGTHERLDTLANIKSVFELPAPATFDGTTAINKPSDPGVEFKATCRTCCEERWVADIFDTTCPYCGAVVKVLQRGRLDDHRKRKGDRNDPATD